MKLRDAGRERGSLLRILALVAIAALGLHELRCLLGAFDNTEAVRLGVVVPLMACAGVLVLGARLLRARLRGNAQRASAIARLPPARRLPALAAAIAGFYLAEVLAEGLLFAGGLGGLGLLAPGGLCVLPLALALAPICLFADRWSGRLEAHVAAAGERRGLPSSPLRLGLPLAAQPTGAGISPLALGLARRGPPLSFG